MKKYGHVTYDHRQGGCEDEWEKALNVFGLILTQDPVTEGSDQYGYYVTEGSLNPSEIREIMIDNWGLEMVQEMDEQ